MVHVETIINSSVDLLWCCISDFANWRDWHQSDINIVMANGIPQFLEFNRSGLPVKIQLSAVVIEKPYIEWVGAIPFSKLLLNGRRRIEIQQISGKQCRLVQQESFHGLLSPFFRKTLVSKYSKNYELLNRNLKLLIEGVTPN